MGLLPSANVPRASCPVLRTDCSKLRLPARPVVRQQRKSGRPAKGAKRLCVDPSQPLGRGLPLPLPLPTGLSFPLMCQPIVGRQAYVSPKDLNNSFPGSPWASFRENPGNYLYISFSIFGGLQNFFKTKYKYLSYLI